MILSGLVTSLLRGLKGDENYCAWLSLLWSRRFAPLSVCQSALALMERRKAGWSYKGEIL